MVRKSVKITVCTMAAVMAFSGMNITANAAASSSVLPSGGIELTLAKGNKLESLSAGTNNTDRKSTRLNSSHLEQSRMPSSA